MTTRTATATKTPVKRTAMKSTPAATRRSASRADADSPILPIDQLEGLRKIKPDAVDWVIQQTQLEAEYRRAETKRLNELIFIEHLLSQLSALLIGVGGVWAGAWVAVNGQPWVGFAIAATVVFGLAVVQVSASRKRH